MLSQSTLDAIQYISKQIPSIFRTLAHPAIKLQFFSEHILTIFRTLAHPTPKQQLVSNKIRLFSELGRIAPLGFQWDVNRM